MKTLTDPKISVTGDQITICATIVDKPFNALLVTRVSHSYINPDNPRHPRRIQSSNEAVFLEAPGAKVAIPNEFITAVIAVVEPRSSFAPILHHHSKPGDIKVVSELPHTVQWQICDDPKPFSTVHDTPPPPAVWTDIPGETSEKLDESKVPTGHWVRAVLVNASGTSITIPTKKV